MKGLNWFQARALAKVQRRPIRREAWEKWMLWRSSLWLMEDGTPRHVVTNAEFGAGEFLAKDWTDQAWEGGSYPPCTTPGGADAFAPNDSGGLGAWTTTGACGGAGDGGGVLAAVGTVETPPIGLALYAYALPLSLEGESSAYDPPLTETAPVEIRATDGETGLDGWQFSGSVFVHYNVTGSPVGTTEIVGLWTLEGITAALNSADLKGVDDFVLGDWDSSMARPFFGHTITSHGRSSRYYLGSPAAVALPEPYPLGGVGFTAVPATTVIRVMLAQRLADGTMTNIVETAYTLPPFSGEVRYWNEEQSYEATCGAGTHGTAVTRTVAEHTYSSSVSVAAANATALSVATAAANADLVCEADFPNEEQTATCEAGTHGTPVTVAAGTYFSTVSVADANATALAAAEAALVCEPD